LTRIPLVLASALLALGAALTPARAQMPPAEHASGASAPLFVPDLPVGTVAVRVARPNLAEAVTGVEVTGQWTTADGKQKSAVAKTGSDGRAVFSGIPAGSSFTAKAAVEGQDLVTEPFVVPDEGGIRLLMIVGAKAAEDTSDMTDELPPGHPGRARTLPMRGGKVEARDGLSAGKLELRVIGADGTPIPKIKVSLVHPNHATGAMDVRHATTDDSGTARFVDLPTGEAIRYAAAIDHEGLRLATDIFTLEPGRGSAGDIRLPKKTRSLSVLRLSANSRMLLEVREKAIGVLQNLVIENTSDQVFDPGSAGLFIPLPDGFSGAEKLQGGAEVDLKDGIGAFLHRVVPPAQLALEALQVRLGYVLARHETSEFELVQPMPLGLEGGLVMVSGELPVTLSAPGLRVRPPERDDSGNELRIYDLDAVAPGQALRLTVQGLPTRDKTGKWIAGVLAALLVLGGVVALRRPRAAAQGRAR